MDDEINIHTLLNAGRLIEIVRLGRAAIQMVFEKKKLMVKVEPWVDAITTGSGIGIERGGKLVWEEYDDTHNRGIPIGHEIQGAGGSMQLEGSPLKLYLKDTDRIIELEARVTPKAELSTYDELVLRVEPNLICRYLI